MNFGYSAPESEENADMSDHVVTVLVVVVGTGLLVALGAGIAASIRKRRKKGEAEHEQNLFW